MPRANHEPEYRRRIRQNAEQHRQTAETERDKSKNNNRIETLIAAIDSVRQEFGRSNNEQTPQTKYERRWRKLEVFGLWAAALVGVAAIWVGNHDAERQRGVMIDQLSASQSAIDGTNRLADASKISADIAQSSQRAWVGPTTASTVGTLTVGDELHILVPYHNTGREPGLDFFFNLAPFTVSTYGDQMGITKNRVSHYLDKCLNTSPNKDGGVVYPTIGFSSYSVTGIAPKDLITYDVIYGVDFIVVPGCFVYKTHEIVHWSAFCFAYQNGKTKPEAWSFCKVGNYAD